MAREDEEEPEPEDEPQATAQEEERQLSILYGNITTWGPQAEAYQVDDEKNHNAIST